jgi:hypothetical protein
MKDVAETALAVPCFPCSVAALRGEARPTVNMRVLNMYLCPNVAILR